MAKISSNVIGNWLKLKTHRLVKTGGKTMSKILIMKDDVPAYVNICDMQVEAVGGIPQVLYIGEECFMLHGQYPNAVYYPAKVGSLKPADIEWQYPYIEDGHKFRAIR